MTLSPAPTLARWRRIALRLHATWRRVWEPRAMPIIYVGAIVAGASIFVTPIRTVQAQVGYTLMGTWGGLLIFGGIVGVVGLIRKNIDMDLAGTMAVLVGWLLYAGTVWALALGAGAGNRIVQAVGITCLAAVLYDRYRSLGKEELRQIVNAYTDRQDDPRAVSN